MIVPGRRSWTKGRVILIKSLRLPLPVRRMSKLQSASLEMHKSRQGRLTPCANGQPFRDLSCCGRSFPTLKHCAYRMSGTKAWPAFSGLLLHQILTRHWAGSLRCRVVTACCRACTCRSWPKTGRFPRSGAGIHPQILLTRRLVCDIRFSQHTRKDVESQILFVTQIVGPTLEHTDHQRLCEPWSLERIQHICRLLEADVLAIK